MSLVLLRCFHYNYKYEFLFGIFHFYALIIIPVVVAVKFTTKIFEKYPDNFVQHIFCK